MKTKSWINSLVALAVVCGSSITFAQIPGTTVTTLFQDDPDVRAFTSATDSDPNCLQVLADGRLVWFESESTAGNNAADAVILFDETQSGAARFTVLASEAALGALIGEVSPAIFAEDIAVDSSDNVYLLGAHALTGADNYFVAKIPNTSGVFGAPELIAGPGVAPTGIPPTDGFGALDYDAQNDRLILLITEDVDGPSLSGIEGLYTLPVTSGGATPVSTFLDRTGLVAALTPAPSSGAGDRGGFDDIEVLPTGDILAIYNARGGVDVSSENDGDCIVVDPSGPTASLFIDATTFSNDIATSFGSTTTYITYNPSNSNIAFMEEFTTVDARQVIAEYNDSGAFVKVVADKVNLLTNSIDPIDGTTELRVFSRAFHVDSSGNYYVFTGLNNESCQRIFNSTLLGVKNWLNYDN